jgi:hypothetical protein
MDPIRQQKRQNSREQLWSVMHNGKGKAGQVFNFTLVLLILISVSILRIHRLKM